MITTVGIVPVDIDNPQDWSRISPRRNGQLFGHTTSRYYLMADLLTHPHAWRTGFPPLLRIEASNSLVVTESPLRYSLQNAFDGDPTTSFVPNDDAEILLIRLPHSPLEKITKIAISAGSVQELSYGRNNSRPERIELMSIFMNEDNSAWLSEYAVITLKHDSHFFQVFDVNSLFRLRVLSVVDGVADSKPHLSGLNFYHDELGWLFGDIVE